jgi:hypothetical protein
VQHRHAEKRRNRSDDQSLQAKEDQGMVASLHKNRQRWTFAAGMHFQFIKLHTIFGTDLLFFSIDMLKNDGTVPMISLFKQKRTKGWWPL